MQRSENNSNKLDEVIEQEIEQTSCNVIRTAAKLANERIHKSLINSHKRKASTVDKEVLLFFKIKIAFY